METNKVNQNQVSASGEPNDLALAQTPRENAGDAPHAQAGASVGTERESGCCQQRLVRFFRCVWHWIRKIPVKPKELPWSLSNDPKYRSIGGGHFLYQWWRKL